MQLEQVKFDRYPNRPVSRFEQNITSRVDGAVHAYYAPLIKAAEELNARCERITEGARQEAYERLQANPRFVELNAAFGPEATDESRAALLAGKTEADVVALTNEWRSMMFDMIEEIRATARKMNAEVPDPEDLKMLQVLDTTNAAFLAGQVDGFRLGAAYLAMIMEDDPKQALRIIRALSRNDFTYALVAEVAPAFQPDFTD